MVSEQNMKGGYISIIEGTDLFNIIIAFKLKMH